MQDVSMNSLRQRLDALFEKKLFTNSTVVENFKGAKGVGKKSVAAIKKTAVKVKKTAVAITKKATRKRKKKKSDQGQPFLQKEFGFTYVTRKSLRSGKGWRNLFNIIFFIIPALILLIAKKIVNIDILQKNPLRFRRKDKRWIYNSGIEFLQIFIAAYMASSFYHLLFVERHRSMELFLSDNGDLLGSENKHFFITVVKSALFGLQFLPRFFHFIIYDTVFKLQKNEKEESYKHKPADAGIRIDVSDPKYALKNVLSLVKASFSGNNTASESNEFKGIVGGDGAAADDDEDNNNEFIRNAKVTNDQVTNAGKETVDLFPFKNTRTLLYLIFYCFAFFVCSFLLSKIAKLFLDVFIFKANPVMYFFILLGIIQWVFDVVAGFPKIKVTEKEEFTVPDFKTWAQINSVLFWIYLLICIVVALACAPIAQAVFTFYLLTLLVDFVKIWKYLIGDETVHWNKEKTEENGKKVIMSLVQFDLEERISSRTSMNGIFHKYLFKNNWLMFSFLLMIFFFWKCLTTFIPWLMLKNRELRYSFFVLNFLICLICGKIYHSSYMAEYHPEKKEHE